MSDPKAPGTVVLVMEQTMPDGTTYRCFREFAPHELPKFGAGRTAFMQYEVAKMNGNIAKKRGEFPKGDDA